MKVLWLCNIVLPDFSQEFGIRRNPAGGWMTGMLHELEKKREVDISLCFPIYDANRKKDGVHNGHNYYTFLCRDIERYDVEMIQAFEEILKISQTDIVHIWGTEYPHTTAMVIACKNRGILEKVVINIQGLISVCAKHYLADIPEKYLTLKTEGYTSIKEDQESFAERGKCEIESLKLVHHVIGRTDWDQACVKAINPGIQYHFCDEILRKIFCEYAGRWNYGRCQKHSIFISQASYPIKGFHYLLQALPVVLREYPDTHVYVAGKDIINADRMDPYGFYIKNQMEKLELTEFISFLGKLDEKQMAEEYLRANVFVSTSIIENSPNSLSEAMLIGTPSVVSYVGGIGSRIEHNVEGILYPHDEPNLLAYYICKLFENKNNLCEKISVRGSRRIKEANDSEINVERTMKVYESLEFYNN